MDIALDSLFLASTKGRASLEQFSTRPPKRSPNEEECRALLATEVTRVAHLQRKLYAHDRWGVLLVFQAMDAAGKDGTIRAVMSGVDPSGCQVYSFKQPSPEDLDHDFLWRTARCLPERGRIGIFNRSYYEEVLVVRVHPELLERQKIPKLAKPKKVFAQRYEAIRDHEQYLARNGIAVVKFFLHVSKKEQRRRFLERLDDVSRNWKFSAADLRERALFGDYMKAYEEVLRETSRPWAPWYVIPADNKEYMRIAVAKIVADTIEKLKPTWPVPAPEELKKLRAAQRALRNEK